MGFSRSTYFAYGLRINTDQYAWVESEHAEAELPKIKADCPDVGHLSAGDYDRDMFFLVTKCNEVDLGEYEHVTPQSATAEQLADWDRQLVAAAMALGYKDTSAPGWLVVPDCS
ncbi:hypothetical protein [Streptomyces sp. NRRL F-5123]|uniref:hypothetical protein n=1 Tax=Streptomyces sp. NRRL F-5123 TaxID=1463856 RepID=UPI0004E28BAA|nr:hypothetical protein [Streptomyces sp. NRRL F-5123]